MFTSWLVFSLLSFTANEKIADEFWKQLGLEKQTGTTRIKESFLYGYLQYYGAKNIKNIATGNRTEVAKGLLAYTKEYVNGPEFKKVYEKERAAAKPAELQLKPLRTKEEIRKAEIERTDKSISETEQNMKKMNAEMKKVMEPILEMLKKNRKELDDPGIK